MVKALRTVRIPEEALPGTEFIVFSSDEIVETGITSITMKMSEVWNRDFTPAGQTVKWFRDELDQTWVKFSIATHGHERGRDICWPSDRVVKVEYDKSRV